MTPGEKAALKAAADTVGADLSEHARQVLVGSLGGKEAAADEVSLLRRELAALHIDFANSVVHLLSRSMPREEAAAWAKRRLRVPPAARAKGQGEG